MKKILIIGLLILMFSGASASAAIGDPVQPIYSTDILTYIDGIPIKGYNIGGQTLICLEDLSDYGFSVYYDDEMRYLFVNKQGKPKKDFAPTIERGVVGGIEGYTYETDIRALLNSEEIHVENIGGKLAVTAETLDDLKDDYYLSGIPSIRNYPKYFMMQSYTDFSRVLNVYSDISINYLYEKNISDFESDIKNQSRAYEIVDKYTCEDYTQYIYRGISEVPNYRDNLTVVRFYKNGSIMDYTNVLLAYCFTESIVGSTNLYDKEFKPFFSEDGTYLTFKARRTRFTWSLMGVRNTFEEGEYRLNLNTCELEKIDTKAAE